MRALVRHCDSDDDGKERWGPAGELGTVDEVYRSTAGEPIYSVVFDESKVWNFFEPAEVDVKIKPARTYWWVIAACVERQGDPHAVIDGGAIALFEACSRGEVLITAARFFKTTLLRNTGHLRVLDGPPHEFVRDLRGLE